MFRISSSTVDELATTFTTLTGCRVSPFMALAALLWAHVNRARSPLLAPSAIASSTMVTVVDLRTRLGPPFTDLGYIGNCVLSAKPTCQVSKDSPAHPLTADVIAPLAAKVSHSIRSFTRPVIESRLATIVSSTTSPPMTDCEGLTFANGLDIYITDWRRIGINNEWDIPGTSSSKPAVVRRACWKGEGGIVVLPRRAEGDEDWEVMISLEDGELKAFAEEIRGGGWLVGEMEKEVEGLGRAKL
ncbi:hypothetical protein CC86DRAFT_291286 [Ophiobolus disseminans]|uniref:Uncharacterized protein n=1 Tax=Ophiobolus disseminans TaxID=1469910 RepID=A0A6A7A2L0_9PLEO|nr:hypothetical protein CC86DRAFT_291286 [Ophiobolus disseminans]